MTYRDMYEKGSLAATEKFGGDFREQAKARLKRNLGRPIPPPKPEVGWKETAQPPRKLGSK